MRQAPSWLPYRLRAWVDERRIAAALRGLRSERCRAMTLAEPEQADAEVHMLLCRRDLLIGVLAARSLLRFGNGRLALTITTDGTLTEDDIGFLHTRFLRFNLLQWPALKQKGTLLAEPMQRALAPYPQLAALYHSTYAPVCKLLHPMVLGRCNRIIVMDPDTAFFRRPDRLMKFWTGQPSGSDAAPLYLHDHQDESTAVPAEVREAFGELERHFAQTTGRTWRLPHRFFNSGLLAYRRDALDLDIAEKYLAWWKAAPQTYKTGKSAIWFGDWTPEQSCYHALFALPRPGVPPAEPLGDDYHLGGEAGHVFNHFLRHYLVRGTTLAMLRPLVKEVCSPSPSGRGQG